MKKENEHLNLKLDIEERIKAEEKRIKKLYKDFPKSKRDFLEGLISSSAFLKVNLEDMQNDLLKNGMFEIFEQGSQRFERERPQTKTYSTYIQKYAGVQKQLIDILPSEVQKKETNDLAKFMQKGNSIRCKTHT